MVRHHTRSIEEVLADLKSDPAGGLADADARARLERDGRNELPPPKRPSALKRFFAQFANPLVLTLVAAAVIAVINGASKSDEPLLVRYGDAIAIILIVALNAVLGYYQETRAEAALDALQKMQVPNARVRRGDKVTLIAATELVAGDVLELEAGDAVPADARLLQTIDLATVEASLTGESMPVAKDARAACAHDAPLGDRPNMLLLGSTVVRGKARAIVVATGPRTELGRIDQLIHVAGGDRQTPLEEKLDVFGKRLLLVCLALSALLFGWGLLKGDRHWHELLLEAVSLAVAAIPEGLPAITTITLALGMQRMAKRGAIVRKLAAVETLGSATVICSDKTGTLTQNEMTVREAWAGGHRYTVTGVGYDPRGEIKDENDAGVHTPKKPLRHLLQIVALANTASLELKDDGAWHAIGDPTEAALLTLAAKGGLPKESVVPSHQLLKEVPFDSDRKRMTVLTLDAKGREVVHTKGSADVLLPLCETCEWNDGVRPLEQADRDRILREVERMSEKSLRVLAVARRIYSGRDEASLSEANPPERRSGELEQRLTFVGLVGMIDPPRNGVKEAVKTCVEAGVRAVMITGDHKTTAIAIAHELGLWEQGAIALTGREIEQLSDGELASRVDSVRVFARVTAEQKLRIVRAFKACGHVVAMTGDGVNDAPALREAHIGVAMGKNGTDVARQAADMVIADDNFATIVEAVREGRAIYRNIQKFIFFLLSSNAGLLVAVFVASFMNVPPLTPLMILWINLVTNGLPALALGVDPPDAEQMAEPPRKTTTSLLRAREYLGILFVGLWMGGAAILCYLWPWGQVGGASLVEERSIAFSLLALSPLFHALNCRSPTASMFGLRPFMPGSLALAIVLSAAIHLVSVLIPSLRPIFRTFVLDGFQWTVMLLLAASIVPAIELLKLLQRVGFVGKNLGPMSRRSIG